MNFNDTLLLLSSPVAPVRLLIVLALSSVRLFVVFYIFPPTADGILQGVVRNGIVLLFGSFVAYGQPLQDVESLSGSMMIVMVMKEAIIGLVLGFAASTVFWVAESAGTYIDDLTGYNNAQMTNPLRADSATPTSILLSQLASVAFWVLGGMTFLLAIVYESYNWWPIIAKTPIASNVIESFVLHQTDSLMQMVAKLATPIMFVLILIDIAIGLAGKSAQKLDLVNLSQPIKGAVTVFILALFVGIFVDQVKDQLVLKGLAEQLRAVATSMAAGKR
ncbi:EscT/YscT/HrcT family type III secretion system export apparatus protein [Paraburkholderia sp. NMBU_R16]|uniref:type III secretion system export apparatus subunit SctT n=1 Tax=Paraburkholderia sp. NMBU_R16 TaxID=2698676 RepID=UPI00156383D1|nr:type III secretion system export apparatus subunit SctT [Paraburkholderia sp. NMBU_R16]NRO95245.1 EscT/YscT/HrcT family type III secretion system export apparatus protein [Paraburkholderia sp. NMBU_R16]